MKIAAGLLALLLGVGFAAGEVWGVWEYMMREHGEVNYLVAMGIMVAIAFALLPMWAAFAWRENRLLSLQLYACWLVAGVVVIGAALTRTGSAVDVAQLDRVAAERAHDIAEQSVKDAERQLASDERSVAFECATGNGPKCQNARAAREATQSRLSAARAALLAAKGSSGDALARRLAATGYVTEEQVRNVWPLLVPLLGSALSAFLISLGVALLSHKGEVALDPIARAEAELEKSFPEMSEKYRDKGDALPAPGTSVAHLAEVVPIRQKAISEGEVTKFMLARMPAADGRSVEIADAYVAYLDYCKSIDAKPIEAKRFARTFTEICKRAHIKTQRKDGKLYCVGRELSA